MEDAGIEPATSRMQSERSATELNPRLFDDKRVLLTAYQPRVRLASKSHIKEQSSRGP